MPKNKQLQDCNYCGVEFIVKYVDEDETVKFCPACGESLDDYILDSDSYMDEDGEWYGDSAE